MKFKRSKFTSIFFLVSFLISISTNFCLASLVTPQRTFADQKNDRLHLSEGVANVNINDILFEENENEDEKEFESDQLLTFIPFFLQTFYPTTSQDHFHDPSAFVIPTEQPIYIQVSNIRI